MSTTDPCGTAKTSVSVTSDPCGETSPTIKVTTGTINGALGGVAGPPGPAGCPEITSTRVIPNPTVGRHYLGYFTTDTEITGINVLVQGTGATMTFQLSHGLAFNGIGDAMFAAEETVTSISLGTSYPATTAFIAGTDTVPANSHIWAELSAVTADNSIFNITFKPTCTDSLADRGVSTEDSDGVDGVMPLVPI